MPNVTSTTNSSAFERLPLEIIDQILGIVSKDPKVYPLFKAEPSLDTLTEPPQDYSLKSLSVVSRSLRVAVLPHLFRHTRIILRLSSQGIYSAKFTNLITFLSYHNLDASVRSLAIGVLNVGHSDGSTLLNEAIWWEKTEYQLKRLLRQIGRSLRQLTIVASPYNVGQLLSIPLDPCIDGALHMPYHSLVLQRQTQPSKTVQDLTGLATDHTQSLLALGWTSLVLNEGSFLRWHADYAMGWQRRLLSAPLRAVIPDFQMSFFRGIKHLTYVSIVPPYQHILDWLTFLESFTSLETLSFQTQPVTDIIPDLHQRGWVNFTQLEEDRDNVYNAIVLNLVREPRQLADQLAFRHLHSISCTDLGADELISAWAMATANIGEYGWMRKSEQEMNVIVKRSSIRSKK